MFDAPVSLDLHRKSSGPHQPGSITTAMEHCPRGSPSIIHRSRTASPEHIDRAMSLPGRVAGVRFTCHTNP